MIKLKASKRKLCEDLLYKKVWAHKHQYINCEDLVWYEVPMKISSTNTLSATAPFNRWQFKHNLK